MNENVIKTQEKRRLNAAFQNLIDQRFKTERSFGRAFGMHGDMPMTINRKVGIAPAIDVVDFSRLGDFPGFAFHPAIFNENREQVQREIKGSR
jgi:hypothetical protein